MRECGTRAEGMKEGILMGASEAHHPQPLSEGGGEVWRRCTHHLKKPDLHVCQLQETLLSFYLYPDRFKPTQGPSVAKGSSIIFQGRGPESRIMKQIMSTIDYILDTILFSF